MIFVNIILQTCMNTLKNNIDVQEQQNRLLTQSKIKFKRNY